MITAPRVHLDGEPIPGVRDVSVSVHREDEDLLHANSGPVIASPTWVDVDIELTDAGREFFRSLFAWHAAQEQEHVDRRRRMAEREAEWPPSRLSEMTARHRAQANDLGRRYRFTPPAAQELP